jgi:hypothetical protein
MKNTLDKKANKILHILNKHFHNKDKEITFIKKNEILYKNFNKSLES